MAQKGIKLSHKLAGLFGSGIFMLVSLITYFGAADPLSFVEQAFDFNSLTIVDTSLTRPFKIFTLALPSAILAGILGYMMGNIFAHPKGKPKTESRESGQDVVLLNEAAQGPALTGDETFLDDLDRGGGPSEEGVGFSATPQDADEHFPEE